MAEFVEVVKTELEMCNSIACSDCGLYPKNNGTGKTCENFIAEHTEQAERIILGWKENK